MKKEIKVFEAEVKESNEQDLTVVHFISTERLDRGRDILYADGMRMEGKPVVLFQHGFNDEIGAEPIAKPIWIKKGEFKNRRGIQAKTQFFPDELGRRLWLKTTEGYMPNWSVGWRPIKQEFKTGKDGAEIRHVYEWELLEYSLVAVPMQPDAQTMPGKEIQRIHFKMLPEAEERRGELIAWKNEEGWEAKPYPNEHACQLEDPDKYIRMRRENDKFGDGIHAIWGIQGDGEPVELQAIRFNKEKFTPKEARAWLKEHDYKCKIFEPAAEKCESCGNEKIFKWSIDNPEEGEYSCHCKAKNEVQSKDDRHDETIHDQIIQIEGSLEEIKEHISLLELTMKDLSERLTALSVAVEGKSDKSLFRQPTETDPTKRTEANQKTVLVINSEKENEEIKKSIHSNLSKMVEEIIRNTVKDEFDRMRGKIK